MKKQNFNVSVQAVTWNSESYLDKFLESLESQTFKNFYIVIVDNGSTDNTLKKLQEHSRVVLIKNSSNLGFSRAHNKAIEMAIKFWQGAPLEDKFIFVASPDIMLEPDCLEKILLGIYRKKNAAMAGPKLLRMETEEVDNILEKKKTDIVDSMGLGLLKSGEVRNLSSGLKDPGSKETKEVFGIDGAFMCLRASALEQLKWGREYFDEDFFAYKEDVDLSWRAQNMGKKAIIIPEAVAYHHRSARDSEAGFFKRIINQRKKSGLIKFLAARNHLWLLAKNQFFVNLIVHFPFIFFREFLKFIYNLFFDFACLKGYFAALAGLPKILKKRAYLKEAKISPKEFRTYLKNIF